MAPPDADWSDQLPEVCTTHTELIRQIVRFEKVLLVAPVLMRHDAIFPVPGWIWPALLSVRLPPATTHGTRDFGPITVEVNDQPVLLDFGFNGWGLKFAANLDNQVTQQLKQQGALLPRTNIIGLVFRRQY